MTAGCFYVHLHCVCELYVVDIMTYMFIVHIVIFTNISVVTQAVITVQMRDFHTVLEYLNRIFLTFLMHIHCNVLHVHKSLVQIIPNENRLF